jgi:hypothetical protein
VGAAQQPERLADVVMGDRAVGAERDHDHVRERVLGSPLAEEREGLGKLPAAVRVGLVSDGREVVQREQHRRVADRERRALVPVAVRRLGDADLTACGTALGRQREREHDPRDQRRACRRAD